MSKDVQDQFKKIIQLYTYGKNVFRFCFFGKENVLGTPILEKETEVSVFKDPESKIQAKKRYFHFIYDPPTRNIRFDYENKILFTGIVNAKEDQNFLNLYLYDKVNIYGLGAINGNYNRNKGRFILRNIDTFFYLIKNEPYASFPFLLFRNKNSSRHFAILNYTSYPLEINIDENLNFPYKYEVNISYYYKRETEIIDFIVFIGSIEEIIINLVKLTGYPYFPPIWSLGYHQSRWSYKTQAKVLEIGKEARKYNLPLDAIYLDIHYMNKYKIFTWHPKRFPNPEKLIEELNRLGIKLVSIVDPGVAIDPKYVIYKEGVENQYFCKNEIDKNNKKTFYVGKVWPGKVHFPDFTKEDVQNWWSKLNSKFLDIGISGIWNDMNEPVLQIGKTEEPLKEPISHEKGSHLKYRNIYANLEAEATYNAFKNLQDKKRPFILSRSGSIGLQKWATLWTGDNHTSWEHLRENLYMIINLNLSGMFFCGADVGGFGAPRKGLLSLFKFIRNPELFERWNELGSLLPFFRNHTILFSYDQEPWKFPKPTFQRVKKHIRRRYQLLLYFYYLFYLSHKEGIPIIRPIFYEFSDLPIDDFKLKDQFFIGKNLLACPILYPKIKSYSIYLPPGDWYEFETGKLYNGNRWIQFSIERGYYPLFIRGGSIIPIVYPGINAEQTLKNEIFFEIYPENSMQGYLYLDDGISTQYKTSYFLVEISGERQNNGDIYLKYEIKNKSFLPEQSTVKLRLPISYKSLYYKKKKNIATQRDLFNEDRKFSVSEFELPLLENWEVKISINK
ncbi:MAG: alpha-glucosidase [Leptospiraceae bacterium]|nr:MAG: alpha-glucosidase [Leptospiraceae bacterium]